ncbi:unnamed protein product [Ceratitis capitata]|uniref:(Mediterranean fruit fly) hypothetical protein n=1 Tax=Ceratitis capitata TaxID=7213 RepID=A0A811UI60_CERCA|nr:unnamed protein product [Ceratitis capitata]
MPFQADRNVVILLWIPELNFQRQSSPGPLIKPTVNICRYRFAAKAFPGQFPHPICGAQLFKVNERGH